MPKLRIPKIKFKPKDFTKLPWTEEFRVQFPTQVASKIVEGGIQFDDLRDYLFVERHMDYRKANLIVNAYQHESGIVRNDSEVLLEICVPICDNQCINCDRTTYKRSHKCFNDYFNALISEIKATREMIRRKGYFIKAVCFTGNVLAFAPSELEELFSLIAYPLCEICVEISDARHVTREKLEVLKKFMNVRFIINALTFNMVTLRNINKHFELRQIGQNLELLKRYGFLLNVSLVVGLEQEHELQMKRNLKIAIELGADCIDLYSRFCPKVTPSTITDIQQIATQRKLLEVVHDYMTENRYKPYFLYCTEVEGGCFENVGYCHFAMKCKFLEDRMYGISTVIGCGVCSESMIVKNLANIKKFYKSTTNLQDYVKDINKVIDKKLEFFS